MCPPSVDLLHEELTAEQQQAAAVLGCCGAAGWDVFEGEEAAVDGSEGSLADCERQAAKDKHWDGLAADERHAAEALGWSHESWDAGVCPPSVDLLHEELMRGGP